MSVNEGIVLVLTFIALFLAFRAYLWEEHFKKHPKDRVKNRENWKRIWRKLLKKDLNTG